MKDNILLKLAPMVDILCGFVLLIHLEIILQP